MGQTKTRTHRRSRTAAKLTTMLVIAAALAGFAPATSSASITDLDNDGLSNLEEVLNLTRPLVADTDGDGLKDGAEVKTYKTNPTKKDTDGDGLTDGAEVNTYKTNPKAKDTDGDGLTDSDEVNTYKTNPLKADSDGDGFSDISEIFPPNTLGKPSNPNDPNSVPYRGTIPDTKIDSATLAGRTLTLKLSAVETGTINPVPNATFECWLRSYDDQKQLLDTGWQPCQSTQVYTLPGPYYTLYVRATDADGDTDGDPAFSGNRPLVL
jgi:Bacterial TSP3 repeat